MFCFDLRHSLNPHIASEPRGFEAVLGTFFLIHIQRLELDDSIFEILYSFKSLHLVNTENYVNENFTEIRSLNLSGVRRSCRPPPLYLPLAVRHMHKNYTYRFNPGEGERGRWSWLYFFQGYRGEWAPKTPKTIDYTDGYRGGAMVTKPPKQNIVKAPLDKFLNTPLILPPFFAVL